MDVRGGWTGVVCDERPLVRRTVAGLLAGCGFVAAGERDAFPPFRELVRDTQPAVAVVSLPLMGMSGLAAVRLLRDDAPACAVVVLSGFGQLETAALEAGARALLPENDPQALRALLRQLGQERAAAVGVTVPEQGRQPEVGACDSAAAVLSTAGSAGSSRTKPPS